MCDDADRVDVQKQQEAGGRICADDADAGADRLRSKEIVAHKCCRGRSKVSMADVPFEGWRTLTQGVARCEAAGVGKRRPMLRNERGRESPTEDGRRSRTRNKVSEWG